MCAQMKKMTTAAAIALLGTTAAQASITAPGSAGGSEAVLWVIRNSDSSAIAQDLGLKISQFVTPTTDLVNLDPLVANFISAAGGLSGVTYSVTAADIASRTYLTSLLSIPPPPLKNGVINGTWNSAISNSSVGALNAGDASPTSANNAYGPFDASDFTNPITSGFSLWGSSTDNTGPGTADLYIFTYVAGTAPTGDAAVYTPFGNGRVRLTANNQLQLVPVSAAAWLFASAVSLLGMARRKSA